MKKTAFQPKDVGQAVMFAEAHLRVIGLPELSPTRFVRDATVSSTGEVTAGVFPSTRLRVAEVLPGLRLKAGNSIIDIVKVIPTNKEVIYRTNRGGEFRMPTDKFVKLAIQQGYKKVWNIKNFLMSLKALLKPVLDSVPLMWVMKWVLNMIRGKKPMPSDRGPEETVMLEHGRRNEHRSVTESAMKWPPHETLPEAVIREQIAKAKADPERTQADLAADLGDPKKVYHFFWSLLDLFRKGKIGWEDVATFQNSVIPKGANIYPFRVIKDAMLTHNLDAKVKSFHALYGK